MAGSVCKHDTGARRVKTFQIGNERVKIAHIGLGV